MFLQWSSRQYCRLVEFWHCLFFFFLFLLFPTCLIPVFSPEKIFNIHPNHNRTTFSDKHDREGGRQGQRQRDRPNWRERWGANQTVWTATMPPWSRPGYCNERCELRWRTRVVQQIKWCYILTPLLPCPNMVDMRETAVAVREAGAKWGTYAIIDIWCVGYIG